MRLSVIVPPMPAVSLEDARHFIGADLTDEMLELLLGVAQAQIEPPNGVWGRAFGIQTLEMTFGHDAWACGVLRLWCPPIVSIEHIDYADDDGAWRTLDLSLTALDGDAVVRAPGASWPATASVGVAARVRYIAGAESVPEPVRMAIILGVQQMRAFSRTDLLVKKEVAEGVGSTEWDLSAGASAAVGTAMERLLEPYRVRLIG